MNDPKIAGLKPLKLMQWRTHFGYWTPNIEVAGKMVESTVMDDAVVPVTERWCYVIAETKDRSTGWEIIEEAWIDDRGRYRKVLEGSPYDPIKGPGSKLDAKERGEPSNKRPKNTVIFPKFVPVSVGPTSKETAQEPLWIRLLFAPFRLPSIATQLLGKKYRDLIAERVRPLWEWEKGSDPRSPLVITDGSGQDWSFKSTTLWVTKNDTHLSELDKFEPIAVGFDPFTVAENLSDDYVEACTRIQRAFERPNAPTGSKFQKMALFDMIASTVLSSDAGKKRYKGALDISKMNEKHESRKSWRRHLVRKRERAGGNLCKVLASEFVWLYQQASFSTEGLDEKKLSSQDESARSERLDKHIRWLGYCTRYLEASLAGRALLSKWAEDSEKHDDHFINHVVLPEIVPSTHYFKSFRWGAKAIVSVLAQFISHKVARRRSWTAVQLANEVMTPLTKLAELRGAPDWVWFKDGTFDPKKHIKGIGNAGDVIQTDTLNVRHLQVDVQVSPHKIDSLEVLVVEPDKVDFIADWIEAGELKDFGRQSTFLEARLLAGFVLDGINVALSLNAVREQWGKSGQWQAMLDTSVATLSVAVNLADVYYQKLGLSQNELLRATRTFTIVRGAIGAYYGYTDLKAARKSFREGDEDYGTAMYVAAGLEFTAAAATFYTAFAVGSTAGPWVGVVAGLLAAGTYVIAGLLKDDELEKFLKRCEWGVSPYLAFDKDPKWATKSPAEWEKDYVLQQQLLLKLLAQVSVSWASHGNAVMGVTIRTNMLSPEDHPARPVRRHAFGRSGHRGSLRVPRRGLATGRPRDAHREAITIAERLYTPERPASDRGVSADARLQNRVARFPAHAGRGGPARRRPEQCLTHQHRNTMRKCGSW